MTAVDALLPDSLSPHDRAQAALVVARAAAESGDCLAAEVAQDECLRALEDASSESAEVISSRPMTYEAVAAKRATDAVGAVFADVCLLHSRARVAARRAAR